MKTVKKFPVLLIVSVVLCALGYVLRPLMPGLADMFRHLGFIWIGYGVFALLLKQPKETRARAVCSLTRSILSYTAVLLSVFFGLRALGVDVTASLASVGVVTLIIGFGAQSLIEDVLTGIFLIAEGALQRRRYPRARRFPRQGRRHQRAHHDARGFRRQP